MGRSHRPIFGITSRNIESRLAKGTNPVPPTPAAPTAASLGLSCRGGGKGAVGAGAPPAADVRPATDPFVAAKLKNGTSATRDATGAEGRFGARVIDGLRAGATPSGEARTPGGVCALDEAVPVERGTMGDAGTDVGFVRFGGVVVAIGAGAAGAARPMVGLMPTSRTRALDTARRGRRAPSMLVGSSFGALRRATLVALER
jgi:hypothetical protein